MKKNKCKINMLKIVFTVILILVARSNVSATPPHDGTATPAIKCSSCHALHVDSPYGFLNRDAVQETLCKSCHNPSGQANASNPSLSTDMTMHFVNNGQTIIDCGSCHDSHARQTGTNLKLVRTNTTKYVAGAVEPATYTVADTFTTGSAPFKGICQSCHSNTTHFTNYAVDGGGHSGGATDCRTCHTHNNGFKASCLTCHDKVQNSRRIIAGANSDYTRTYHHVNTTLTSDHCVSCHDTSGHQQGTVKLIDPDNVAVTYSMTGTTVPSAFCINCHDSDGATRLGSPLDPFGDGTAPPDMNKTAWNEAGGHDTGSNTCMDKNGTLGCHNNGHGSNTADFLFQAAGDALCYTCHDGTPASNIQAIFASTNKHNLGVTTGLYCSSCHNPHWASTARKLVDPDSVTQRYESAENAAFCLKCHDGAPPAGITFAFAAQGTGFNKSNYVSTKHKLNINIGKGAGIDSCRGCHDNHGSNNRSMLLARYDIADNANYSSTIYALCFGCHNSSLLMSSSTNTVFENLHDKHVSSVRGPCFICHDVHSGYDVSEVGYINFQTAINKGGYSISHRSGYNGSTSFYTSPVNPTPGNGTGYCQITCHYYSHTPKNYNRGTSGGSGGGGGWR